MYKLIISYNDTDKKEEISYKTLPDAENALRSMLGSEMMKARAKYGYFPRIQRESTEKATIIYNYNNENPKMMMLEIMKAKR